jgi:phospholipid/cholesterol/gamma-HCH transport system substrate-binding protein
MVVDRKYQTQITEGAVASLKTQGALGDRYVYIEAHPAIGSTLKDGDTLKTADSPDLFEMISSKGAQFDNILDLIKDVQRLVHTFNEHDRMTVLMENMTQASQNLNGFLAEGRATLKDFHQLTADSNTKEALVHFNSIMKKIDHGDGTLGALINDPSLHDRLLALVGENPRNKYMKSLLRQSIQAEDGQKK